MKYVTGVLRRWPIALAALVMMGIVHLATALALPYFYQGSGYWRTVRSLPLHKFVILPQPRPGAQVLQYQMPDARIAICRFNVGDGPVSITAELPDAGWSLSIYTPDGRAYYSLPASGQRRFTLTLTIFPPGDRFMTVAPTVLSQSQEASNLIALANEGAAVIRAPIDGRTFADQTERALAKARCIKGRF